MTPIASTSDAVVTIGDIGRAPIGPLLRALGQAYADGPALCPACSRARRRPPTAESRPALFVQSPTRAYCFGCGRSWTVWALRRIVVEDAHLVRLLARELAVTE